MHWGLNIGTTDTEAVSLSVQKGGLDIGTYGYRNVPPCAETESASISVLLRSRYPYKASIYVQREGSRYPYCTDKICTLSESQRGCLGNRTSTDTETPVY